MPFKNGRYISGGGIQPPTPKPVNPVTSDEETKVEKPPITQKKIMEKIKNIKVEESKKENSNAMKERLKKFVKLEIK